jgi:hypothetical protein
MEFGQKVEQSIVINDVNTRRDALRPKKPIIPISPKRLSEPMGLYEYVKKIHVVFSKTLIGFTIYKPQIKIKETLQIPFGRTKKLDFLGSVLRSV